MPSDALFAVLFGVSMLLLLGSGYAFVARYWPILGRFWVIVGSVAAVCILISMLHELMFGAGLRGVPTAALQALVGGVAWSTLVALVAWGLRRAVSVLRG